MVALYYAWAESHGQAARYMNVSLLMHMLGQQYIDSTNIHYPKQSDCYLAVMNLTARQQSGCAFTQVLPILSFSKSTFMVNA